MKTIQEAVDALSTEQLKNIAASHLRKISVTDMRETLYNINSYTGERGVPIDISLLQDSYKSRKKRLLEMDLWNPEYDAFYEDALKGEMDTEKL